MNIKKSIFSYPESVTWEITTCGSDEEMNKNLFFRSRVVFKSDMSWIKECEKKSVITGYRVVDNLEFNVNTVSLIYSLHVFRLIYFFLSFYYT